jgi:hypothetical protein
MSSKEALLGALIRPKIEEMGSKLKYWGQEIVLPEGESWTNKGSLTLEKFLELHPIPSTANETNYYGIAWEFIWGEQPPEAVIKARQNLVEKAQRGDKLEPIESLWFKLITVDTDSF